jgi:hypothetical protein
MRPILWCAKEWVGANLANQRRKAYICRMVIRFGVRSVSTTQRPPTEAAQQ